MRERDGVEGSHEWIGEAVVGVGVGELEMRVVSPAERMSGLVDGDGVVATADYLYYLAETWMSEDYLGRVGRRRGWSGRRDRRWSCRWLPGRTGRECRRPHTRRCRSCRGLRHVLLLR